MHIAVFYRKTSRIRLLIAAGAFLGCKTKDGQTLLDLAIDNNDRFQVELLLNAGACPLG